MVETVVPSFAHLHDRVKHPLDDLLGAGLLDDEAMGGARAEAWSYRGHAGDSALISCGTCRALLDLLWQVLLDDESCASGGPHAPLRARLVAGRVAEWEHPLRTCVRARLRTGHFPNLFVGERRSTTAIRLDVRWEDGRLAARTLHAALRAAGLDPAAQVYANLFADPAPGDRAAPFVVAEQVRAQLHAAASLGVPLVALGRRVGAALARDGLYHRALIHPAARGAIRRRDRSQAHVAAVLRAGDAAVADVAG